MMFRKGTFERHRVPAPFRQFSPTESLHGVEEVSLTALQEAGKTLILLDVDNTLLPWKSYDIPATTSAWIEEAKSLGFQFCVLSNTRHPTRLEAICKTLDIPCIRDRFKPSTRMYQLALKKFHVKPEQAVMIGDQLLTDIWGANRAQIDAIWVRPLAKREFFGTRYFSRNVEILVGFLIYRYFQSELEEAVERPGLFRHEVFNQLVKFIAVGITSFAIDTVIFLGLMFAVKVNGQPLGEIFGSYLTTQFPTMYSHPKHLSDPSIFYFKIPSTCVAILNGYYWNMRWTFSHSLAGEVKGQLRRYFAVSLAGLLLNASLTTWVNHLLPAHLKFRLGIALIAATMAGAVWNFLGSRYYVFTRKG